MTECERIVKKGIVSSSFLEPEVRDNYMISEKMKKVWTVELDLLEEFKRICIENALRFWVGFGTMLGAVRHGGFIPWDDDMDVWMPREDYNKLLALNLELKEPYFLQTTLNDKDYYNSFARIRNSNTTGILVSGRNLCNNGIYIDIYPLDGLDKNKFHQWVKSKYIRIKNVAAHAYMYNVNPSPITQILHSVLRLPFIYYDYKKVYQLVNKLASNVKWENSSKVGMVVFAPYAYKRNIFDKADFEETEWTLFENTSVPIPHGYNNVLSVLYGDYMKYPPIEKRGQWHHFIFEPDIPYVEYIRKRGIISSDKQEDVEDVNEIRN